MIRVYMVEAAFVKPNPEAPGQSLQERVNDVIATQIEPNQQEIVGFNASGGPGSVFVATLFVEA